MKPTFSANLFYANLMIALIAVSALVADLKADTHQGQLTQSTIAGILLQD